MNDEWLRQWQSFAAQFAPVGFAAPAGIGPNGAAGFASFAETAERFKTAAQIYLNSLTTATAHGATQAAQQFSEFLREQFADSRLAWGAVFPATSDGATAQSSVSDGLALGASREYQQRAQRMADAARRIGDAQRRLQRMWSDALHEAASEFATRVHQRPAAATNSELPRELYDSWIDCAEASYAQLAHSAAYCDAQAELVNASSAWRREAQAAVEQWAKLLDLPTRSEFNTLARRLKSLEEQFQTAKQRAASEKSSP